MAESNWQGPAIGAGAAFLGSIPQLIEAQRLKRERERLLKEGPGGYTPMEAEQIAAARARAASSQVPGYAQEMEGIAQQQADVLAAGKRGSATSSNLLNLLSRLNMQGQAARRNLAMRGAQTQRQAQSELASIGMNADARREQRRQMFERDLSEMDAARRQYQYAPFMAPLQGAAMFMPYEGLKFGERKPKIDVPEEMETMEIMAPNFGTAQIPQGRPRPLPIPPGTPINRYPPVTQMMYNRKYRRLIQSPIRQPYYSFDK
jgi:hypothetical protein